MTVTIDIFWLNLFSHICCYDLYFAVSCIFFFFFLSFFLLLFFYYSTLALKAATVLEENQMEANQSVICSDNWRNAKSWWYTDGKERRWQVMERDRGGWFKFKCNHLVCLCDGRLLKCVKYQILRSERMANSYGREWEGIIQGFWWLHLHFRYTSSVHFQPCSHLYVKFQSIQVLPVSDSGLAVFSVLNLLRVSW